MGSTSAKVTAPRDTASQPTQIRVNEADITGVRRDATYGLMQSKVAGERVARAGEETRKAERKESFIDRITHSSSHILVKTAILASLVAAPAIITGAVILVATSSANIAGSSAIVVAALAAAGVMGNSSQ